MPIKPKQQPPYYKTKNPVLQYIANLSYDNTGLPPIVNILNNTFGTITWTFSTDHWLGTMEADALEDVEITTLTTSGAFAYAHKISNNEIALEVFDETYTRDISYWPEDGTIEIKFYKQ